MAVVDVVDSDQGTDALDVRGLPCPLPFLLARKRLAALVPGQTLVISASDAAVAEELAAVCAANNAVLISDGCSYGIHVFRIIVTQA